MPSNPIQNTSVIPETIYGIVDRVTFHNPDNGWSVLRVFPFNNPSHQETVIVHQTKVFAGATMEFYGAWTNHPKHGRQFVANQAIEKKPATTAALEKYLGSGLIKGVGPKTAHKIVKHFGNRTLDVFEQEIEKLTQVTGIAHKKLAMIKAAWIEHRAIREVMMFLQSHGISTLFAVRIYKQYGDNAIFIVTQDPYRLANDFYGIGFFSADKIALSIGLAHDSPQRMMAGIKHVLAAAREFGHCYLTLSQIERQVQDLLEVDVSHMCMSLLGQMQQEGMVMARQQITPNGSVDACYYSKSLYYDELYVAERISQMQVSVPIDQQRVDRWVTLFCKARDIALSSEQAQAVKGIVSRKFSILTGGPGCGKTTATQVLVKLIEAMHLRVMLCAPTGRAAQRMTDVVGREAKTIHRLLEWQSGQFKKCQESPLDADFLIVDECSMLDINLTASLLKAVPEKSQVLFIGDSDQLPSVGAGNVLRDIIESHTVACFRLTQIFRQAQESYIVSYAHQINHGQIPPIDSPFKKPGIWQQGIDCIFIDSDEATKEQMRFVSKVRNFYNIKVDELDNNLDSTDSPYAFRIKEDITPYETEITIPKKFQHVNLDAVLTAQTRTEELLALIRKVHPWSSLHYGLCASDIVLKLYTQWIPKYYGRTCEIQVLSPMTRGSLGTHNLNNLLQQKANPAKEGRPQLKIGERILRKGDRVIHRRNNYDLGVFNGDIGVIEDIDNELLNCTVSFFPDHRKVLYQRDDIVELDLAYAITIHKSQGSEFETIIIPITTQHFKMLFRNLIYTGLTRAKKLAVFVGTRKALAMAIANQDTTKRQTALETLLKDNRDLL